LHESIPTYEVGKHQSIDGWNNISNVLLLDQSLIGRSSRSNVATYMKIYDDIRRVMASQTGSARRSLSASDFSFNVDGGRCAGCKGDGFIEVDMHFMANVRLLCEDCDGKRFKKHVLEVNYKGKSIDDILHTTVKEAILLFLDFPAVVERCQILDEVGLGYLQLGQSAASLSGGECQRLKIAATLDEERREHRGGRTLYIFDEPTTGLHLHDIKRLSEVFHRLVDRGHSVLFIEHNMELVAQADWIIDVGPGGGAQGGTIVAQGTPEDVAKSAKSLTGKYLKHYLR
jgi:excinuclease ABC subunit A